MNTIPVSKQGVSLAPRDLSEAMEFAKMIAHCDLAPPSFKGKPGNIIAAIQMGYEVGLAPMQALQNIAVINNRPCVWGDAALALVQNSSEFEAIEETADETKATCIIKRRGQKEHTEVFTKDDAVKAGLWNKPGPWQQYPKRMLQMRARGFALRNKFADVLKGLNIAEEVRDYIEVAPSGPEPHPSKIETVNALLEARVKDLALHSDHTDEYANKRDDPSSEIKNPSDEADLHSFESNNRERLKALFIAHEIDRESIGKWFKDSNALSLEDMPQAKILAAIRKLERKPSKVLNSQPFNGYTERTQV